MRLSVFLLSSTREQWKRVILNLSFSIGVMILYFAHATGSWWLLLSLVMASKLLPTDGSDLADKVSQMGK